MNRTSYNLSSRILHWVIAGLILFMIFLGWRLGDHDSLRLSRTNLHKSVGILILLLSLVRIGFRLAYKAPPKPPMSQWEIWAAKTLHVGFYVVMIGMPLTGWLMVSTSAREIPFFGLPWPHLPVPQTHATHELFETLHGLIAKLIIYAMVPLHVVAALKHQFIDKDEVMQHMVPGLTPKPVLNWRWIVPVGVIVLAVGFGYGIYRGVPEKGGEEHAPPPEAVAAPPSSEASSVAVSSAASASVAGSSASASGGVAPVTVWTMDKAASHIAFSTTFSGEAINGNFGDFDAAISFDPKRLDASHVKVTITLNSVVSGDADRDSSLRSDSFFNIDSFPKATFEASHFTRIDDSHFIAHGKLTLHGVTRPCDLPFNLNIKNGVAMMSGATDIDRIAFGVGTGDWAKTDAVPAKVHLDIRVKARAG
ncbi:YceI family protein [Asticcacaulis sp. EMRT-3]|uniref:YceI family protein n=1 Tax=Asticcacaulis sp. EMRT-3 TaxID=3040349 RepID=UPI0024AFDA9E|nr:YceI family protein [Asticcacaulis sp. EMRT-3]MDI7774626.1 YceI family protein [Asticcacaulis sp. EMRT-3]